MLELLDDDLDEDPEDFFDRDLPELELLDLLFELLLSDPLSWLDDFDDSDLPLDDLPDFPA